MENLKSAGSRLLSEEYEKETLLQTLPYISTGFPRLDDALCGGIAPGLIVLGGSPGMGKSTFALCLAEQVSASGNPVIYFSFEMPENRILSKLIARRNYQNHSADNRKALFESKDQFNIKVLQNWEGDQKWEPYLKARREVAERAKNLYIIDCNAIEKPEDKYTAEKIANTVRDFVEQMRAEGSRKTPLVIIDYLQIIPAADDNKEGRQLVDQNLDVLLKLARTKDDEIPVILISSLSRGNYAKPLQMDAFKESGNIEYSADLMLGIQFFKCHQDGFNQESQEKEKKKEPREVEVAIIKQRYGVLGEIHFNFVPRYDSFEEVSEAEQKERNENMENEKGKSSENQKSTKDGTEKVKKNDSKKDKSGKNPEESDDAAQESLNQDELPKTGASTGEAKKNRLINNTKIAGELRRGSVTPQTDHVCVVDKGQNRTVTCRISESLSSFDFAVADAFWSIFDGPRACVGEKNTFSMRHVLFMLTGNSVAELTRQKQIALLNSIERLRRANITITTDDNKVYGGPLLNVGEIKERKKAQGIKREENQYNYSYYFPSRKLGDVMPLHAYAEDLKQVVTFPVQLLNVEKTEDKNSEKQSSFPKHKKLSDTAENIVVKHFLIHRLEVIRRGASETSKSTNYRTISFEKRKELIKTIEPLLKNSCSDADDEKEALKRAAKRLRKTVETVLKYYKKLGYIENLDLADAEKIRITGEINDPSILNYDGEIDPAKE